MKRLCGVLLAATLVSAPKARAAASLVFGTSTGPANTRHVTFEEVVEGAVRLDFANFPAGVLDVYPATASPEDRVKAGCTLTVAASKVTLRLGASPACDKLLTPLFRGEATKLALSRQDTTPWVHVVFEALADFDGKPTTLGPFRPDAGVDAGTDAPDWSTATLPAHLEPLGPACYTRLDQWVALDCANRHIDAGVHRAAIEAAWDAQQDLELALQVKDAKAVQGAWRNFPFVAQVAPVVDAGVGESDDSTTVPPLPQRCATLAHQLPQAEDDFYAVCVDALPQRQGVAVMHCEKEAGRTCEGAGQVVRTRHAFQVFVWHETSRKLDVQLSGTPGFESLLRDKEEKPSGLKALVGFERPPDGPPPTYSVSWGPRRSGDATLTVKVSEAGGDQKKLVEVAYAMRVVPWYRMAVRLGVSMNWMPWARTVEPRTDALGQRYVAVTEGEDQGLFGASVVAGFTWFASPIDEDSAQMTLGLGLRLGVLGLWGRDVKPFDSVMAGLEWVIGPDFSLGLFGGVARHETPVAGYEPGRPLGPNDTLKKQFALTPALSVVLNFTPGFLKRMGVAE